MKKLSQDAVRGLMVAAQGLQQCSSSPATKVDVLQMIRQMQVLQIDTIHVVARSPYLVLWSRLGDFEPGWLDELLAEGNLFEYWAHAMCFIPSEDYPLYRRRMLDAIQKELWPVKWAAKWLQEHSTAVERVRTHLHENGAVRSAEFENKDHIAGGWWNWKEEKDALASLHLIGEVMIARRQHFQRVYELRERILPDWDDGLAPPLEAVLETFVLNSVKALGVTKAAWIADYFRLPKKVAQPVINTLAKGGHLRAVEVEGWNVPGYFHPDYQDAIDAAAQGQIPISRTTLLSPFDPMVWDRARAQDLFNFTYQIECYTPAPKRIYGYFTLPILYQNRLIGRLDPKAHRKEGVFEVKALHLEPGVVIDDALVDELQSALHACAAWHKTPQVIVREATEPGLAERLSD